MAVVIKVLMTPVLLSLFMTQHRAMALDKTSLAWRQAALSSKSDLHEMTSIASVKDIVLCMFYCIQTGTCSYFGVSPRLGQCTLFNMSSAQTNASLYFGWNIYNLEVRCPEGWSKFGQECFIIGTMTTHITWHEAQNICHSEYGGYLAEPQTNESVAGIKHLAESTGRFIFWIGGTDHDNEGQWVWHSKGEPVEGNDRNENWCTKPGIAAQPDGLNTAEDCMFLAVNSAFDGWYDADCQTSLLFICEKEPEI